VSELGLNLNDNGEVENRIGQLMQELIAGLPAGSASLEVKHDPSGRIFYLRPTNANSAIFGIHYDGCIDVFFGNHGTTFELPFESGLPKDAGLDSIMQWAKEMGLAVLAGKCRERAGFLGVRGTIWVKEKLTV
jgi:hypothetical protein